MFRTISLVADVATHFDHNPFLLFSVTVSDNAHSNLGRRHMLIDLSMGPFVGLFFDSSMKPMKPMQSRSRRGQYLFVFFKRSNDLVNKIDYKR